MKTSESLAKSNRDCDTFKNKIEIIKNSSSQKKNLLAGSYDDPEFVKLKFEDWKKKMVCEVCKQRENEIMLQCGHMTCNECIEEQFNNRQRSCPFDGKKITKQNVMKIYWNGITDEQE